MEPSFIRVNKILDREDKSGNEMSGVYDMCPDNVPIEDIKGFRNYKKNGKYVNIPGDICQLTIKSEGEKGGFYTIRIYESEEMFGKRLGQEKVIPLA